MREKKLLLKNPKPCYFSDKYPLQWSSKFDLIDMVNTKDSLSKKHDTKQQLSKLSTSWTKQVGNSKSHLTSNMNLTKNITVTIMKTLTHILKIKR